MSQIHRFRTGLIVLEDTGKLYRNPPYKGKAFQIELHHFSDKHLLPSQKEVVIMASNRTRAQQTLELINSSLELYSGQPISQFGDLELIAYCEENKDEIDEDDLKEIRTQYASMPSIPIACLICCKASHRKKNIYAIEKYRFSTSLFSQFGVDLEPWSAPHLPVSKYARDHIVFSHSIISAYSVLEELGLEIRASSKNPSFIKKKWNPIVRNELEERLLSAGIDLDESLLWTIRGPIRKLEKKKQIPIIEKMKWSSGPVRDSKVDIVDAIAYASWLRSFVASHKVKDITEVISPYDVTNIQFLARRLILESLGYWRDFNKNYHRYLVKKERYG